MESRSSRRAGTICGDAVSRAGHGARLSRPVTCFTKIMRPLFALLFALPLAASAQIVSWRDALKQPATWYGSAEAIRIADNLLLYQHDIGGWDKNTDMAQPLGPKEREAL